MSDRDDRLSTLALALSDRTPVDWDAAASLAASDSERQQIRDLRLVAEFAAQQPAAAPPPAEWGPLRVMERIGRGRFGDVYRAWDRRLDREVALKLIRRGHGSGAVDDTDVVEEARLLARIRHPNVVTVYGAERLGGHVGLWMERIRGETLEAALTRGGPFRPEDAAATGAYVARALDAVHRAGLLHRDVKAQNVMRDNDGRIVLMDFGAGRELQNTMPELAGTPLYLAPEVLEGSPATTRSDIFSAGVLIFHLATGTFPFPGRTLAEIRLAHQRRDDTADAERMRALPARFRAVIARALATDPDRRFDTAADLAAALDSCVASGHVEPGTSARRVVSGRAGVLLGALVVTTAVLSTWAAGVPPFARERLDVDAAAPRTICDGCRMIGTPSVSAGGRLMALVDAGSGDLVIRDLRSGATTPMRVAGATAGLSRALPVFPVFSADAEHVAFMWISEAPEAVELRVVSVRRPGEVRRLVTDPNAGAVPIAWSGDGASVLATMTRSAEPGNPAASPRRTELAWISVQDGTRRIVMPLEFPDDQVTAAVSPDGRRIAFAQVPRPRSGQQPPARRPLFLIASEGGTPSAITQDGLASHPVWSADGSKILFRSNSAGTFDLWSVAVDRGLSAGAPILLRKNIGAAAPISTTADDDIFFYEQHPAVPGSLIVTLDTPDLTKAPRIIGSHPAWSPDGRFIAVLRPSAGAETDRSVIIHELATGIERPFRITGLRAFKPLWFGDSNALLVLVNQDQGANWCRLDIGSGELRPLIANRGDPRVPTHWNIRALAPDGATMYFGVHDGQPPGTPINRIVAADLRTGIYRDVLTLPGDSSTWPRTSGHLALAVSPDNRALALHVVDPGSGLASVWRVDVDGRHLQRITEPQKAPDSVSEFLMWTRSDQIFFASPATPAPSTGVARFRLMQVAATGSVPHATAFESPGWMNAYDASPDGARVVFDGVPAIDAREGVWVMRLRF